MEEKEKMKRKPSYVFAGLGLIVFGLIISTPFPFFWGLLSFVGFFTAGVFLALRGMGKV